MSFHFHRSLFAAVAFTTFLVIQLEPAFACQRKLSEDTDKFHDFEEAENVFRGLAEKTELTEVKLVDGTRLVKIYYRVEETLKGNPPENGFILSYNGYFGGCAVPVLVGLEYLFAPSKNGFIVPGENPKIKALIDNSIGSISIFTSFLLPMYEPRLDEEMEELRQWAKDK